jgi:hypothetical protein
MFLTGKHVNGQSASPLCDSQADWIGQDDYCMAENCLWAIVDHYDSSLDCASVDLFFRSYRWEHEHVPALVEAIGSLVCLLCQPPQRTPSEQLIQ